MGSIAPRQPAAVVDLSAWQSEDNQSAPPEHAFPFPLHANAGDGTRTGVGGALVQFEVLPCDQTGSGFATATGPSTSVRVRSDPDGLATAPALVAGSATGDVTVRISTPEHLEVPQPSVTATVRTL